MTTASGRSVALGSACMRPRTSRWQPSADQANLSVHCHSGAVRSRSIGRHVVGVIKGATSTTNHDRARDLASRGAA
jgi:hypothetical protein